MLKLTLLFCAAALAIPAETINFDSDKPGALPSGWSVAMTHAGGAPKWEIVPDATAPSKPNAFAQTSSDSTGGRFPLAIYQKSSLKDGEVSVSFKPVSGKVDQGAGLVWRYQDPNTYYIARANALENNVVLYKVEAGKRLSLAPKGTPARTYGVKHKVSSGIWSTLRVTFQGTLFSVYLNGEKMFDVVDTTFSNAGKVGLWTKADSVIYFDNFEFK